MFIQNFYKGKWYKYASGLYASVLINIRPDIIPTKEPKINISKIF